MDKDKSLIISDVANMLLEEKEINAKEIIKKNIRIHTLKLKSAPTLWRKR